VETLRSSTLKLIADDELAFKKETNALECLKLQFKVSATELDRVARAVTATETNVAKCLEHDATGATAELMMRITAQAALNAAAAARLVDSSLMSNLQALQNRMAAPAARVVPIVHAAAAAPPAPQNIVAAPPAPQIIVLSESPAPPASPASQ
jgi:hypothetical protein